MGSFDGMADIYHESRHGYPPELRDHLVRIGALADDSVVVDLGAGTGQLATMAADVAAEVIAIDPEPDMVRVGRRATAELPTVRWVLGADRDLLELLTRPVDLVLIGNAFHHMNRVRLLADLDSLVAPSGAVVVCSASIPVWLHDTAWSTALRQQLSRELGRPIGEAGTPNHESDMAVLSRSPFSDVERWVWSQDHHRRAENVLGEILSSASGAIDEAAAERLLSILEPYLVNGTVPENVQTTALIARRPATSDRDP
jgi:SAM-dependent methyltransferase